MTVTTAKMGRRKQNYPQKTGNNASGNASSGSNLQEEGLEGGASSVQEESGALESDSMSVSSEKELPPASMNGNEHSSTNNNNNPRRNSSPQRHSPAPLPPTPVQDPLGIFKNPLFNPALLSLNPSLYAVQLAHLQAAQLLSQASSASSASEEAFPSRKRKIPGDEDSTHSKRPMSPKESPLDLTKEQPKGPPFSPAGKLDPFAAAAALSPFFSPFLAGGARQELLLSGNHSPASPEINNTLVKNNHLERMSEIVKGPNTVGGTGSKSTGPRHSAWQSQWINRGPENSKDIFKCVWCKDAFSSLQDLTDHMKETKHFGPQIPPPSPPQLPLSPRGGAPAAPKPAPPTQPYIPISTSSSSGAAHHSPLTSSPKTRDILKEQLPMPRKLVRGQDVWLGRGEQQTRDILKCMWCGQSFRSLDLMTKHMQETKHYTKVISQEQLSSWKAGGDVSPAVPQPSPPASSGQPPPPTTSAQSPQLNSVLTCKVCEISFSSLRELSDHMVKNNHYTDGKSNAAPSHSSVVSPPPPPASREKRKKSLPVKKLLELERAQQELIISGIKSDEGKITCEKCCEKIPVSLFASHIHLCVGSSSSELLRRPPSSSAASSTPPSISPPSKRSAQVEESETENEKGPKSILGSLEKMVQGNFGGASKKKALPSAGGESSLSILQRLGIDESIPTDFSRPNDHAFRPIPNFLTATGGLKFGVVHSSRSDSSECSSPDRSKQVMTAFQESKDEDVSTKADENQLSALPMKSSLPPSPAPSQRSFQDYSMREEEAGTPNSLVDKQQMGEEQSSESPTEDQGRTTQKKNPLAALQMLCDKTEKPKASGSSPHSYNNNNHGGPSSASGSPSSLLPPCTTSAGALYSDPGAILAFSWACNQAIVNDSLLKCPFCETPFISKGAYRHHLSKMHFVKDDKGMLGGPFAVSGRAPEKSPSPMESSASSPSAGATAGQADSNASPSPTAGPTASSAKAENAQSKFQKYSQLAKQLSCSSQP